MLATNNSDQDQHIHNGKIFYYKYCIWSMYDVLRNLFHANLDPCYRDLNG